MSWTCQICGSAIESDDTGFPPTEVRELLLKNDGTWIVHLSDEKYRKSTVLVLKNLFEWTHEETIHALQSDAANLFTGTKAEVAWIALALSKHGIPVESIKQELPQ